MGGVFSNPVDEITVRKNQEYISEMNRIKVLVFDPH